WSVGIVPTEDFVPEPRKTGLTGSPRSLPFHSMALCGSPCFRVNSPPALRPADAGKPAREPEASGSNTVLCRQNGRWAMADEITRREFLKATSGAVVAAGLGVQAPPAKADPGRRGRW